MKTISRYIMTLALLLTAATGAWAQGVDVVDYDIDVHFDNLYNPNETPFDCRIIKMGSGAEIKGTLDLSVDGALKGSFPVNGDMFMGNITPGLDAGEHTWSAEFKPEGGGSFKGDGSFRIKKASAEINYNGSTSINLGVGESTEIDVLLHPGEAGVLSYSSSDASVASIAKKEFNTYIIEAKAVGTATITFSCAGSTNYNAAEDVKITVTVSTPPIKVTTNAAEEGGTFTEASFEMQTSDVDVDYELVRDMGYKVAFSGVPTRARLAKDGNGKFHFADGLTFQLLDNIDAANPKDITSAEGITFMVGEMVPFDLEGSTIYRLDKETLVPLADFLADAHLGNYVICAVASTGEYDGSFSSGMITLFQGYEVTIPAGEYITYYRDEPLKLDDADKESIELYTVSSVTATEAVLSDPFDAAPANTPLLVYNKNTEEAKTILLIPCNEPDLALTVAPEFKGTLEATEIAASSATSNNYAFNGKQFVWVKTALAVGQYKAWLEVPTGTQSAPILTLVFGNTTGIESIDNSKLTIDGWYDLNGRKLQNKPTKKGVYIMNGRKVVVR